MAAIREAVTAQRLSKQTEAVELCRRIIAEATSPLRNQVEEGKMKAGEALRGMEEVVHQLLGRYCDWDSARFRLKEKVKGSDEWFGFEKAIADADRLRAGANQAEASRVQNNGKTTLSAESKSTNKQYKALTDREHKIWEVIRRGLKATPPLRGTTYCREVDAARVSPPRKGIWKDAPRTYVAAYKRRQAASPLDSERKV